jgi:hypothetical protein
MPWAAPIPEAQVEGARVRRIMQGPATPATAPQPPDPAALRTLLVEAIAARTAAQEALDNAISAQRRGEKLEKEAQTDFDQFSDLDQSIADAGARRIAEWAAQGNSGDPPDELFDLEPELFEAQHLRTEAELRLSRVSGAATLLRRAAADAQADAVQAANRVGYIIGDILASEANALAEKLVQTKHEIWWLEDKLASLATLWPGGAPLRASAAVGVALAMTKERLAADRLPNMPRSEEHHRGLWEDLARRLRTDPEAQWEWYAPVPRPWPDQAKMIGAIPSFVPASLAAARRLEAERLQAEAKAGTAGPPPFIPIEALTMAEKFRREKAQQEAEAEAREQV